MGSNYPAGDWSYPAFVDRSSLSDAANAGDCRVLVSAGTSRATFGRRVRRKPCACLSFGKRGRNPDAASAPGCGPNEREPLQLAAGSIGVAALFSTSFPRGSYAEVRMARHNTASISSLWSVSRQACARCQSRTCATHLLRSLSESCRLPFVTQLRRSRSSRRRPRPSGLAGEV